MAVTYQDVAVSLGRPITESSEIAQVNQWIADALLLIAARLGDTALLDQAVLDYVVREAVTARLRNPEGYQSESIDDYTYRWGSSAGRVAILDEWWRMLSPSSGTGAFTIRPYYDDGGAQYPDWWHDQ